MTRLQKSKDIFSILYQDHSFYLEPWDYTGPATFRYVNEEDVEKPMDKGGGFKLTEDEAARRIQRCYFGWRNRIIFKETKKVLRKAMCKNPEKLLMKVNIAHAQLFERNNSILVFRMAGEFFPPSIVYKVYTKQHVVKVENSIPKNDENAASPKLGTRLLLTKKGKCDSLETNKWYTYYTYVKSSVAFKPMKQVSAIDQRLRSRKNYKNRLVWISEMYGDVF